MACLLIPLPAFADITFDPSDFVPTVALRPLVYFGLVAAACALAAALALLGVLCWRMIVQARRLTASQERLRAFLDRPSDWVWEADGDGRLTYVSPGFTRATGVPVEQVLGRSRAEALAGRVDGRDLLRHARDLRARRPFDDLVAQHVRPDGQRIWIRSSGVPRYDARGRFVGYIGTSEDITREVEADRRLADFRIMLEHVFAQVPDALMLVDAEGHIVGSNAALSALTGLAPEELLGRKGGEFLKVHGNERETEPNPCPFGFPRPGPAMLHRNDGALVPVEMVGSPIRAGEGPAIGAFALVRDRRGTVAAERALAAARDAAEQASRTKSEFLAQVSHELRTPLNAILGFAEILSLELYGPLGDGRYRGYARDIHSSGTHLLAVINDLLDLSRVEAGRLTLNESAFSVDTVVAESVRLVSELAARERVSLSVELEGGDERLVADERLVKQMLLNLLSNAVRFTPAGGTIAVSVNLDDNGELLLSVVDNGVGIAEEDLGRLGTLYEQASRQWRLRSDGTGIGLYLVESLMKAHGGTMRIASQLGAGTTVSLHFPSTRVRKDRQRPAVNA